MMCLKDLAAAVSLLLCVLASTLAGSAAQAAQDSPYVIDFSRDHSLKPVFDSGLRPKHAGGLKRVRCEVMSTYVAFVLPGGVRLPIRADNVEFSVYKDDNIGEVTAVTGGLSIEEAFSIASEPYRAMGGNLLDLRKGLDEIAKNPRTDAAQNVGIKRVLNGAEVRVGFIRGPYVPGIIEKPVRLFFSIAWVDTRYNTPLRDEAIKPPPGYEHISMAPERDAAASAQPPKSIGTPGAPVPEQPSVATERVAATQPVATIERKETGERKLWPWFAGGLVVVLLFTGVFRGSFSGSFSSLQ